ncbi:MAG: hypothetical protein QW778_05030 [Candidatus Micrarchaeaceae archaeon]
MQNEVNIPNNRLCCLLESFDRLFFSLVDYHNTFFMSNDPEKIIEFYSHFKTIDELIKWMKERPKGVNYIHEVEGNKDIIVVIPTADFDGKYAKACRDEIFKGLHMIFVESGGKGDFYFNYAHNCNVGIKKALEYSPKWIIVSNDDMYKIDDISILIKELGRLDYDKPITVLSKYKKGESHSYKRCIGEKGFLYNIAYFFYNIFKLKKRIRNYNKYIKFNNKLGYIDASGSIFRNIFPKFLLKNSRCFIMTGDFGIFSRKFLNESKNILFDHTFINCHEDMALCYEISISKNKYIYFINYNIGSIGGISLGKDTLRVLRYYIINDLYFIYKYKI